ncbi:MULTISPECIES: hypothetical protein [unclassified Tolypothrix]|nr:MULTISPECIES: hypothetical protein [unclassified Tolypothrix]EKF05251.1 hypothetical protein FDUTEX481_01422 [Tolypothrix sp. PCC 7601]
MGTRDWGLGEIPNTQLPITNYQLPITHAQCPIPNALFLVIFNF